MKDALKARIKKLLSEFLKWRIKHLSDRRFLIALSILIGIFGGLAASLLKTIIHFIEEQIHKGLFSGIHNVWYFVFPLIGIFGSVLLLRFWVKNRLLEGVPLVLYSIGKNNSNIPRKNIFSYLFTSALTVSFGGSVGLEGPSVATGSAIGSNIGQLFHLNQKRKSLLIGCGSAAAISALFNAPVAAVIFVLEILLVELKIAFIVPLLMSSVTATLISKLIMGNSLLFKFGVLAPISLQDIPFYVLLGLFTGFLAVFFIKNSERMGKYIKNEKKYVKSFVKYGLSLGVLLFLFPTLYGEGYYTLRQLLQNKEYSLVQNSIYAYLPFVQNWLTSPYFLYLFLVFTLFLKVLAMSLTKAAGGVGGVFAPSLFMGGLSGFLLARGVNLLNVNIHLPENNFLLVGMAGVTAGIMHAPLSSIFLIAEITSGYDLFIPLMLVVALSYASTLKYNKHNYYTKKLAEKGDLVAHDRDKSLLHEIGVLKVIEKDLITVNENGNLKALIEVIARSKRNIFPILNDEEALVGIILLDDVRHLIFDAKNYDLEIKALMHPPPAFVYCEEHLDTVMDKFDHTQAWNLPVIKDGKYYGFLSKSKIFSVYREKLSCSNNAEI